MAPPTAVVEAYGGGGGGRCVVYVGHVAAGQAGDVDDFRRLLGRNDDSNNGGPGGPSRAREGDGGAADGGGEGRQAAAAAAQLAGAGAGYGAGCGAGCGGAGRLLAGSGGALAVALGRDVAVLAAAGGGAAAVGEGRSGELGGGRLSCLHGMRAPRLQPVRLPPAPLLCIRAAYAQVAAVTAAGQLYLWGLRRAPTPQPTCTAAAAAADDGGGGGGGGGASTAVAASSGGCGGAAAASAALAERRGTSGGTGMAMVGVVDGRPARAAVHLVRDVALGHRHVVAVVADAADAEAAHVCTWGDNRELQLGRGQPLFEAAWTRPERVPELSARGGGRVVSVAAGAAHSLALTADGGVRAWGTLHHNDDELLQVHAVHLPPITAIACADSACAALAATRARLYVWGRGQATPRALSLTPAAAPTALLVGALEAFALADVGGAVVRLVDVTRSNLTAKRPAVRMWRLAARHRIHHLALGSKGIAAVVSSRGLQTPLEELATRECAATMHVPVALQRCLAYVEVHRSSEGLFRLAGSGEEVAVLEALLDAGVLHEAVLDAFAPASVAAFVKRFLRQLPTPLLALAESPASRPLDRREARGKRIAAATVSLPAMMRTVLARAPAAHLALLRRFLEVAHAVRDAPANLMDANSLSIVLSAALFGDVVESAASPAAQLEATQLANRMARVLLDMPLAHWAAFWPQDTCPDQCRRAAQLYSETFDDDQRDEAEEAKEDMEEAPQQEPQEEVAEQEPLEEEQHRIEEALQDRQAEADFAAEESSSATKSRSNSSE